MKHLVVALVFIALLPVPSLAAQEQSAPDGENAVGLTLAEVFAYYGQPDAVHAVRGSEEWQDDVVFVYGSLKLDVYIYKDRVWQVCVQSARGLKKGDRKAAALLALADSIEERDGYLLYNYPNTVWPKYARFNLDAADRITMIYVYRPDM
ncbi:MAG: hypothetical protein LBK61_09020 [Spirochaetaceae bacterium]|nr:hypothetical protein [Spirochaetaceae bacterium]